MNKLTVNGLEYQIVHTAPVTHIYYQELNNWIHLTTIPYTDEKFDWGHAIATSATAEKESHS